MYISNFMKPALHDCINEYVWQTFFCKNKIYKKHILFLETTIIRNFTYLVVVSQRLSNL